MSIQSATPYFILNGKVEQAIELYRKALGAEVTALQRFGQVNQSCPEAQKNLVMHAELRLGSATLMMSDGPGEKPLPEQGGSVSVALLFDDEAQTRAAFEALGAGGRVIEPLFDAPWGDLFGVVQDAFGISWMFNCTKKAP